MNYNEAVEFIINTPKFRTKAGLENMAKLLSYLNNPHKNEKFIHVAGTNGKGSTCTFIRNILTQAGYKVGLFTSPCIIVENERISIDGVNISDEDMIKYVTLVKDAIFRLTSDGHTPPTQFEIFTAVALCYFKDNNCDIIILEVGLGGKYDATNVIENPLVCVITKIAYDHTEYLGKTLYEIADNKAAIIKNNTKAVTYKQDAEAQLSIEEHINRANATLYIAETDKVNIKSSSLRLQTFDALSYKNLKIKMAGAHQTKNATLAIKAVEALCERGEFAVNKEAIYKGLESAFWQGRLELINDSPLMIIDGAHNTDGANALYISLSNLSKISNITFIVGILADKDYKEMINIMVPLAKEFITVDVNNSKALKGEVIAEYINNFTPVKANYKSSIKEAIEYGLETAKDDGIICVYGSLYYLGEIKKYFLDKNY